jgi:hypothetical protein
MQTEALEATTFNDRQERHAVRKMVKRAVAGWTEEEVLVRALWAERMSELYRRWSAPVPTGELVAYYSPTYVPTFVEELGLCRRERIRMRLNPEVVQSEEVLSLAIEMLDFLTQKMSTSMAAEIAGKRREAVEEILQRLEPALEHLLPVVVRLQSSGLTTPLSLQSLRDD